MNKKLSSLICIALIVIISIPVVSIVFAGKNSRGPPEKIVYIHYKKGYGKPDGTPGKPQKDDGDYKLLVKGAKWDTTEPILIVIDPDGSSLNAFDVQGVIELSAEEWDDGAYSDDWYGVPVDLFGGYNIVHDATFDTVEPDGRNAILFGDQQEGVIAICIVWGYFGGPPSGRYIIEFDIMFNTDYEWSLTGESNKMDLQNIATHELGHGAGLGDLYNRKTTEETMYGYSTEGEIKKRDLYLGDIAGIQFLYGE